MDAQDKFCNVLNFQYGFTETFKATAELRWCSQEGSSLRLQQLWQSNHGTRDWRDVPEVYVAPQSAPVAKPIPDGWYDMGAEGLVQVKAGVIHNFDGSPWKPRMTEAQKDARVAAALRVAEEINRRDL